MIVYPAEFNARKQAVFDALARADGGGLRLWIVPLSLRDWPETAARVDQALSRAKRLPRGRWGLWLKRQLLRGQYNWARAHFTRHPDRVAVAWNGIAGGRMAYLAGARDAGAATLHAELAPFPGRITLDPRGVNAEGSVPADPAVFAALSGMGHNWRAMGADLVARPSRRADVGQEAAKPLPQTPFLFVPLQVPDDTQLRLFAGWCRDMAGFLAALTAACHHLPPGWHLRIKEHPSAKVPLATALAPLLATGRAVLDNDADSFAQVAASRGVVTLNSSMGLQSFFFDKPVVVLGRAYYDLPGLVTQAGSQAALDEAFAAAPNLSFDPALRDGFMTWLDRHYYPRLTGDPMADDPTMTARLRDARQVAAGLRGQNARNPLSPKDHSR